MNSRITCTFCGHNAHDGISCRELVRAPKQSGPSERSEIRYVFCGCLKAIFSGLRMPENLK